jgi:hypothetical protein
MILCWRQKDFGVFGMIKIDPIPWNNEYLKTYIYKKNSNIPKNGKELLHQNIDLINNRIEKYINEIYNYQVIDKFEYNNLHENLYKIYDSNSKIIKELKEKIRNISKTICPYCALTRNPYELDHFLPRSEYPEYSILTLNLVPSCPECNSKLKGRQYKTDGNIRAFLHPYYDSIIESKCFLNCNLSIDDSNNILNIEFEINFDILNSYEKEIINSHFEKLNLYERYTKFVNEEFKKFYKRFIDYSMNPILFRDITIEDVLQRVEEEINSYYNYNCNYYLKVFWKTFKKCKECIQLITDKKIPLDI